MSSSRQVRSRAAVLARRVGAWTAGWLFSAALYLLLIDITDLPELLVGAGAAVLAATGLELVREQGVVFERIRAGWLLRVYRVVAKVPLDIALVSYVALRRLVSRDYGKGGFRAVRFRCGAEQTLERGRHAVALGFGSLAPNTIVIGIDEERELILAHQLLDRGGRDAVDVLELG